MAERKIVVRGKTRKERTAGASLAEVRQTASRVVSGVAGGLNIAGALAKAVGVVVAHTSPAGPLAGRGLEAVGEQLVEGGRSLGAAASLIGGSVVAAEGAGDVIEVTEAEVVGEGVPPGRKPRKAG